MQALLPGPFRIHEVGFGRIHKVEPRPELLVATVHVEAVAVVVLGIHVLAIRRGCPLLLAGPSLPDDQK